MRSDLLQAKSIFQDNSDQTKEPPKESPKDKDPNKWKYRIPAAEAQVNKILGNEDEPEATKFKLRGEREVRKWLSKEDLPHEKEAMELLVNEKKFLKFQKIYDERGIYKEEMDEKAKKEYDAIPM